MVMQKTIAIILLVVSVNAAGQGQVNSQKSVVVLGMSADEVLAKKGKASTVTKIGSDQNGLIVEWQYQDAIYLLARREKSGVEAYRIIKITPR